MFDLTSSKLFLLAVVALLVIGPKDFPILLRTIGRYVGIIRGHAKEFRAQFDEAMRESELTQLKKEMENIGRETEASLNATTQSVEQTFAEARQGVEASVDTKATTSPALAAEPPPPAAEPLAPGQDAELQTPAAPEPAAPEPAAPEPAAPEPAAPAPVADPAQTAAASAAERTGA